MQSISVMIYTTIFTKIPIYFLNDYHDDFHGDLNNDFHDDLHDCSHDGSHKVG